MASRKATKKRMKFRGAFYGPSGSGKTKSMLRLATGIALAESPNGVMPEFGQRGRIGVIDSEEGDSELYAAEYDFNVIVLEDKTIDGYIKALDDADAEGWGVAIIDSLSHAWRSLLDEVDAAKAKSRGGSSFNAWADATPQQKRFVERLKAFKGHLLVSMRADTAWAQETDGAGKNKPVRVGLKPEQGKGIEYEFTFLLALDTDHSARVEKDRTGKFQDVRVPLLTEAFGAELAAWLADGRKPVTDEQRLRIKDLCKQNGIGGKAFIEKFLAPPDTFERAEEILAALLEADPMKAVAAAADKVLADAARPTTPTVDQPAVGQPLSETDTSNGSPQTEESPRLLPQPESSASGQATSPTAPTTSATSKTPDDGAPTEAPADNVLDGGVTETLVLVKRKIDAQPSAPAVAIALAELSDVIEALPKRPRMIARSYAAAIVKQHNGDALTAADTNAKKALDSLVPKP